MFERLVAGLRVVERAFIAVVMIAMSVMFFINVVVREISPRLAVDLDWVEQATLFALAWLVFVGLGLALEQRRHIAMTALNQKLPASARRLLYKLINLTGLAFSLFITKISFDLALFILHTGQVSPTLNVSMAFLYSAVPVGFALLAFRYLLELFDIQDRTRITETVEY